MESFGFPLFAKPLISLNRGDPARCTTLLKGLERARVPHELFCGTRAEVLEGGGKALCCPIIRLSDKVSSLSHHTMRCAVRSRRLSGNDR
jgi:hypothetical protein